MRLQQSGRSWVIHTPAKLNLYLEVLAKRDDGFHELLTLMTKVSLFDTLIFTPEDSAVQLESDRRASKNVSTQESTHSISLRCRDLSTRTRQAGNHKASIPTGPDNLAVRAAELLQERTGVRASIHIDLFKRIPSAAGLAGGSSDAAAVLFALNQIWGLGLQRSELRDIASKIGSDVSFFLSETPSAICRGRGEIIEPLEQSSSFRMHFVIAKPNSGLSTPLVFKNLRASDITAAQPAGIDSLVESLATGDILVAGRRMKNTLQIPAEALNPDINRIRAIFSRTSVVGHMMSGSGTSYFGICHSKKHAQHIASQLRATGEDQIFVVETPP
jgi:4-diphosphocytidyl-2-C-methyl-D-erythritol kinase